MRHILIKKWYIFLLWLCIANIFCLEYAVANSTKSAVTYVNKHPMLGRLGDRMKICSLARIIASLHDLEFLYNPFNNFYYFAVDSCENRYTDAKAACFNSHESIEALSKKNYDTDKQRGKATLYEIQGFGRETFNKIDKIPLLKGFRPLPHFLMQYPEIKNELADMFTPVITIKEWDKPQDGITIAVHVRKGSGGDKPLSFNQRYTTYKVTYTESVFEKSGACIQKREWERNYRSKLKVEKQKRYQPSDVKFPLKFPPEQFYIDQLCELSAMLKNQQLYVRIFSDSKDIRELTASLEKAVKKHIGTENNMIFSYQEASGKNIRDVVTDLWTMAKCDCLIRPASHLSEMAQIVGNHVIAIYPTHARVQDKNLIIDQVSIMRRVASE